NKLNIMGEKNKNRGKEIISWEIPEYKKHDRGRGWYVLSGIMAVIFLLYALFSQNFLFAIFIEIVSIILILNEGKNPIKIKVAITDDGVQIGKNLYEFDDFKNFSIIYKPDQNIKNLYFEFDSYIKQRLSLSLEDINPIKIKELLSPILKEDTDRKDPPLSEKLADLFKL
ncbi:hypothetical protein K8R62_00460, partial [bacterium]|nr:hypothetical protein [bacterium]